MPVRKKESTPSATSRGLRADRPPLHHDASLRLVQTSLAAHQFHAKRAVATYAFSAIASAACRDASHDCRNCLLACFPARGASAKSVLCGPDPAVTGFFFGAGFICDNYVECRHGRQPTARPKKKFRPQKSSSSKIRKSFFVRENSAEVNTAWNSAHSCGTTIVVTYCWDK